MKKLIFLALLLLSTNIQGYGYADNLSQTDMANITAAADYSKDAVTKALGVFQLREDESTQQAAQDYYPWILQEIASNNYKTGVMVGVLYGGLALDILYNTNVSPLVCADEYKGAHLNLPQAFANIMYYLTKRRLSQYGNRFSLIRGTPVKVSHNYKNGSFDFAFFDAGTAYADVRSNLIAWFDKVRTGGLLAGCGYSASTSQVMQAVNDFFSAHGYTVNTAGTSKTVWYVIK